MTVLGCCFFIWKGKRASGLSNSTQYYLTGAWDIGSRS